MKNVKIVTPDDLGEGIEWNEDTQKYEAELLFTDRTVKADIPINDMSFLFRQLKNANRVMVCTGIFSNGEWYGDAPDNEPFTDVFTSK